MRACCIHLCCYGPKMAQQGTPEASKPFFYEGTSSNIFVTTTQFCHCSMSAVVVEWVWLCSSNFIYRRWNLPYVIFTSWNSTDFLTQKMRKPPPATWAIQTDCGRWASEVWCLSPGLKQLEVLGALSSHPLRWASPNSLPQQLLSFFLPLLLGCRDIKKGLIWEFPGGPVVRAPHPTVGVQFIPGWGTNILCVAWPPNFFKKWWI